MPATSSDSDPAKPVECPICGSPAVERYKPFCSKRCADIDLGKWFSGAYAITSRSADEDEDDSNSEAPMKDADEDAQKGR